MACKLQFRTIVQTGAGEDFSMLFLDFLWRSLQFNSCVPWNFWSRSQCGLKASKIIHCFTSVTNIYSSVHIRWKVGSSGGVASHLNPGKIPPLHFLDRPFSECQFFRVLCVFTLRDPFIQLLFPARKHRISFTRLIEHYLNKRGWDYECFDRVHCLQVLHKQFNSPIGLYSEQNITDSVQSQAGAGVTPWVYFYCNQAFIFSLDCCVSYVTFYIIATFSHFEQQKLPHLSENYVNASVAKRTS